MPITENEAEEMITEIWGEINAGHNDTVTVPRCKLILQKLKERIDIDLSDEVLSQMLESIEAECEETVTRDELRTLLVDYM